MNLKAFPGRQFSGLELSNCQWEWKEQALELVLVALVCEQSLVLFPLDPDSETEGLGWNLELRRKVPIAGCVLGVPWVLLKL